MGGDSGQPPAKRVRMGGNGGNSGGVPVPVTYHHQVMCSHGHYMAAYTQRYRYTFVIKFKSYQYAYRHTQTLN
jgi:hypothetical protein